MTDTELYAMYKRTAPREDCLFVQRTHPHAFAQAFPAGMPVKPTRADAKRAFAAVRVCAPDRLVVDEAGFWAEASMRNRAAAWAEARAAEAVAIAVIIASWG